MPEVRILHMETPRPTTRFGQKGLGEGGAIAPPAAITNAVNDALTGLGAELLVSPVTPGASSRRSSVQAGRPLWHESL
jgi:carbon-monoxide dehydrogenase large subunit